jgi:peptidoglycan/xylan/chitin deacetylase (PgdA/CDA1 family)
MALSTVLTLIAANAASSFAGFGVVLPFAPPLPSFTPAPEAPSPEPSAAEPAGMHALRPIRFVETREPAVAITFDACATRSHPSGFDRGVFDVLKREQIPATLFVSGRWVEGHADVMGELAADPLIEFGDHSYDHPHMSHLPVARIVEEIDQTEAALAKYGKRSVAFRPPFGEWSQRLVYVVQDLRLPTVTWDVVSGDPSAKTTADGMIRTVLGKARPGSIIIFHINGRGYKTAAALPAILRGLRERGFRFVQLSELMASATSVAPLPLAPLPATASEPEAPLLVTPLPAASLPVRLQSGPGPQ